MTPRRLFRVTESFFLTWQVEWAADPFAIRTPRDLVADNISPFLDAPTFAQTVAFLAAFVMTPLPGKSPPTVTVLDHAW